MVCKRGSRTWPCGCAYEREGEGNKKLCIILKFLRLAEPLRIWNQEEVMHGEKGEEKRKEEMQVGGGGEVCS
jgi:hypothetical protein